MTSKTPSPARFILKWLWPIALVGLVYLLAPPPAQANPAFARRFNAKCTMCHAPVPPRLNNFGIAFKRLGFRLPDVDDKGSLVLLDPPTRSVFENFALKADFRIENFRGGFTPFSMHEAEIVGGGTAGSHLSYSAEVAWEAGEFALENYEGHLLFGKPETTFTARFGLLNPLLWDKFGLQRMGISRAHVLNRRVPVGAFAGYRPRDNQEGVELGVNLIRANASGALRSTFLSVGFYNGLVQSGNDLGENNGSKDLLAQAMHTWGENHTIGGLWYRGQATNIGTPAFSDTFNRWGLFGNYELRSGTDVLGGFMAGRDETTSSTLGRVSSRSWFIEMSQTIAPRTAAFARWDRFEPRRPPTTSLRSGPTLGIASQALDHLLITGEYSGQKVGTGVRGRDLVLRIVLVY